jgi:nitroreductase
MDVINSIKKRRSVRTFTTESLSGSDRKKLEEIITSNKMGINGETIDFVLFEKNDSEQPLKIPYGLIRNNKTYIFGKTNPSQISRTNYGYLLEKIVLKATGLKLGTCWVGLFDKEYFSDIQVENSLDIPAVLVVGYANEKIPVKEKLIRQAVKADKRKSWETIFFNYETGDFLNKESIQLYVETLEMMRLAPSSGNSQPWRIYYSTTTEEFHFFKKITNPAYELKGMHDIDMGIAMSHFELVSQKNGLIGKWIINSPESIRTIDDLHYVISWKCIQ